MPKKKKTLSEITSKDPVNSTAAKVTSKGVHYTPTKKPHTVTHSETPIPTRQFTGKTENLTGKRQGRLTVIGLSATKHGLWVCRCDCGRYTERRAKSLTNPANDRDRCEECRQLAFLRREQKKRQQGRESLQDKDGWLD